MLFKRKPPSDDKKATKKPGRLRRAFLKATMAGVLVFASYEAVPDVHNVANDTINNVVGTHVIGPRLNDDRALPLIFGGAASRQVNSADAIVNRWLDMKARQDRVMQHPEMRAEMAEFYARLDHLKDKTIAEKSRGVDGIIDKYVAYTPDGETYCSGDYWATPLETIRAKKGDCEDFAILKYYALRYLDVPADRMFVVAVGHNGNDHVDHATLIVDVQERPANDVKALPPSFMVLDDDGVARLIDMKKSKEAPYFAMNEAGIRTITPPPGAIKPPEKKPVSPLAPAPKGPKPPPPDTPPCRVPIA